MLRSIRQRLSRRGRGFNLIEAAIVLGVIGLIIGGIWVAAAAVQSNLRKGDASKGLIQIVQNVRNLYYGQTPTATADITSQLISARALPGDFISGTSAVNPFNGAVTVSISNITTNLFTVAYAAVPQDACIDLTSKNTNINTGIGLSQILIANGTTTATVTAFPYLPTAAAGACAATNTITWTFGLRG